MQTNFRFDPPANKPNPFQVLGLGVDASSEDIVERGRELMEAAETPEQKRLYRWAMEELITHPFTRICYELLEVPGARYEDREWERFAQQHRLPPVDLKSALGGCPPLRAADFDYARLISLVLDALGNVPEASLRIAIEQAPVDVECGPPPLEIKDVIFG